MIRRARSVVQLTASVPWCAVAEWTPAVFLVGAVGVAHPGHRPCMNRHETVCIVHRRPPTCPIPRKPSPQQKKRWTQWGKRMDEMCTKMDQWMEANTAKPKKAADAKRDDGMGAGGRRADGIR